MNTKEEIAEMLIEATKKLDQIEKGYLIDLITIEDLEEEIAKEKTIAVNAIETKSLLEEFKTSLSNATKRANAVDEMLSADITHTMKVRDLISKKTKLRYLEVEQKKQSRLFRCMETLARLS
jgi:hypothetical protein